MLPIVDHHALFRQDLDDARSQRVVRFATHRACAPADAPYVELACRARAEVLPRWHQDDRGPQNATRGHHEYAPDGAYSAIPVWASREHWLTCVVPAVVAFHAEQLHGRVSVDLMRRYLSVRSGYAVAGTGRRCIVRPNTIASVLGVGVNAVKVCQRIARQIGLEVVIATGRMLTQTECLAARRRGSRQRGLSTEVAFTTPASVPPHLWIDTPTSGTNLPAKRDFKNTPFTPQTAARGQIKDAASPRRPQRRRVNPVIARRLAWEVAQKLPWCSQQSPRRLAPALTRFVTCSPVWDAHDVVSALTDAAVRAGKQSPTRDRAAARPWALLAAMLRELDETNDYPGAAFPTSPTRLASCDLSGCDGWIPVVEAGHATDDAVRPCPDPAHRRANRLDDEDGTSWDSAECPF